MSLLAYTVLCCVLYTRCSRQFLPDAGVLQLTSNYGCVSGLSQAVQGAKTGRRDSFRRVDRRGSQASLNGVPDGDAAASNSLQTSTDERQAVLGRLQGSEQERGDLDELLAAAAKVLQDAGTEFRSCPKP